MSPSPYVLRLAPVEHATALGPEKRVLDRVRAEMGFVPNMMAHMANAPALLSTFVQGHFSLRDESGFTAAELEVLYLTVSRVNGCGYCMAAHSHTAAQHCGVAPEVLAAVRNGEPIPDARLAALHDLTVAMMHARARPDEASVRRFLAAGYQERDLLYVVLAIAVMTLANFSNRLMDTPLDAYFAGYRVP